MEEEKVKKSTKSDHKEGDLLEIKASLAQLLEVGEALLDVAKSRLLAQQDSPIRKVTFHQAVNSESNFSNDDVNKLRRYRMILDRQRGLVCIKDGAVDGQKDGQITIVPFSNVIYMKT